MESIVFNYTNSKIHPTSESFAIRMGYLFTDRVIAAGISHVLICFGEIFSTQRHDDMLDMIGEFYKTHPSDNSDGEFNVSEMKKVLKAHKKIKHDQGQGIIMRKKSEKAIETLFLEVKNILLQEYSVTALPQLYDLFDKGGFDIMEFEPNEPEKEKEPWLPVSKLMQLQLPEEDETPLMFCLTTDFFYPDWRKQWNVKRANHFAAAEADNIYLQHCFTVPNLNNLTSAELESVHNDLAPVLADFLKKTDEWMKLWQSNASASATNTFFCKEIIPLTPPVLQELGANEILQRSSIQSNKILFDVFLGEVPVYALWEYYRNFDVLKDDTWKKLEKAKEKGNFDGKRFPVMLFNVAQNHDSIWSEAGNETENLSSKKSLSID